MKTSTKQEKGLFVLLIIFMIQENISSPSCSIKMCLNCTLGPGILKLTCKIDKLHLPVSFHNNFGKEIAFCSLPFPSPLCISGYKNTTVRQNIHTNETVVTIREIIDQRINGNWSCLHGYGRDMYEADFEINIPILEGQHKREKTDDLRFPKKVSWYTIAGISITVITLTIVCVLGIYICKKRNVEDDSTKHGDTVEDDPTKHGDTVEDDPTKHGDTGEDNSLKHGDTARLLPSNYNNGAPSPEVNEITTSNFDS